VLQPQGNLDEEKAAFRFAAALLAPASNLRAFIGTRRHHIHLDELILLKHHFGMSIQALLYRMLTLEIISQRLYRSLMIELSERGWRTQEPEPLPLEEPIWLRRAVLRALAEELIDPAEAQRLLSGATTIPVDQPEMGRCQQLLHQPLPERHAILAAQAETARDLYQVTATPAREVITSEYS
jgi:Zn-dependent peptidase ImmA (M78 family)